MAWTAQYKVERIDAGGFFSGAHTDEGLICRYVEALAGFCSPADPTFLASPALELCTSSRGTRRRWALGLQNKCLLAATTRKLMHPSSVVRSASQTTVYLSFFGS